MVDSGKRILTPVILCGGSGTRLWPLSIPAKPKQYHSLIGNSTLLAAAVERASLIPGAGASLVICNSEHAALTEAEIRSAQRHPARLILEPCGRNTAPAVAAAALLARADGEDPMLVVLPADHVIADQEAFRRAVAIAATAAADGRLVTFGIVPDRAETGYGYVKKGQSHGDWSQVAKFVEKPDAETAERYLKSGQYLWNSGMFLFRASVFLAELERCAPQIIESVRRTVSESKQCEDSVELAPIFAECPAESIDYAVMEKTDKAAVVPLDAGWSDVGSWDALHDLLPKDGEGNSFTGDVLSEASHNCLVRATHRRVGIVGLEDIVVVETEDAVLVMSKRESQSLKNLVGKLPKS